MLKFYFMSRCVYFFSVLLFLISCGNKTEERPKDTLDSGTIYISVDESFKPVIDSEIKVFESQNPAARIIPFYKPEAECIKDLIVDSIRMVIITRGLTPQEENFIVDSFRLAPKTLTIATDAVAVIVNPSSPDSLFTMTGIKQILEGKFSKSLIPILDGVHATSTLRFLIDSVLHGDSLTSKAMAADSSEGVIDYVSKNPNAVGFIGVSWIGNHDDSAQMSFLKKVKIAALESTDVPDSYVQPWQANIYTRRYPMTRDLVYILKEKYTGLGRGFTNFLTDDPGQLIFKRAYLVPALKSFTIRDAQLNE